MRFPTVTIFFSFYCGTQLQILIIGSSAYRGLERVVTFLSFSSNIKLNYLSPSSSNSIGLHKFTLPPQSYCPAEFLASWNVIVGGNSQSKSNRHPPQLKPLSPWLSGSIICCCLFAQLCLTLLQRYGLQPASSLCPWDFPGKNTGVGCHFLLQGISPTQEEP